MALFQQHHATLALAAGFLTRYVCAGDPRLDQAQLVMALHAAYVAAEERIIKQFRGDLDRGAYKRRPARRAVRKALLGDLENIP